MVQCSYWDKDLCKAYGKPVEACALMNAMQSGAPPSFSLCGWGLTPPPSHNTKPDHSRPEPMKQSDDATRPVPKKVIDFGAALNDQVRLLETGSVQVPTKRSKGRVSMKTWLMVCSALIVVVTVFTAAVASFYTDVRMDDGIAHAEAAADRAEDSFDELKYKANVALRAFTEFMCNGTANPLHIPLLSPTMCRELEHATSSGSGDSSSWAAVPDSQSLPALRALALKLISHSSRGPSRAVEQQFAAWLDRQHVPLVAAGHAKPP